MERNIIYSGDSNMCLGGWHSRTCWYAEMGVRRKEESWVTAFLMMVPFTQIRANKRKNLSVEGGRQWFSCRTSCVPFSSHLLLSSRNSGHEIERKKKKREQEEMCALIKIIHSLNRYISFARPSLRFCCCLVASVMSDSLWPHGL